MECHYEENQHPERGRTTLKLGSGEEEAPTEKEARCDLAIKTKNPIRKGGGSTNTPSQNLSTPGHTPQVGVTISSSQGDEQWIG